MSWNDVMQNWRQFKTYPIIQEQRFERRGITFGGIKHETTTITTYNQAAAQYHNLDASWLRILFYPTILGYLFVLILMIGVSSFLAFGLLKEMGVPPPNLNPLVFLASLTIIAYPVALQQNIGRLVAKQGASERGTRAIMYQRRRLLTLLFCGDTHSSWPIKRRA